MRYTHPPGLGRTISNRRSAPPSNCKLPGGEPDVLHTPPDLPDVGSITPLGAQMGGHKARVQEMRTSTSGHSYGGKMERDFGAQSSLFKGNAEYGLKGPRKVGSKGRRDYFQIRRRIQIRMRS